MNSFFLLKALELRSAMYVKLCRKMSVCSVSAAALSYKAKPCSVALMTSFALLISMTGGATAVAQEPQIQQQKEEPASRDLGDAFQKTIPELADFVKQSLVVIRPEGRDGQNIGLGTGFVISNEGLIATARHCIEEGHGVRVETVDGKLLPVTHIYSQLEAFDVVILKVDASGLAALPLGDSDNVIAGQSVVAVGHPEGLRNTVFDGIVAGREEIDGLPFLKLSMKVERGSSGEPVVDRQGKVIALVTLKSTQQDSVGFAVPVNDLKRLLADPAPISIERWKTIGALDTNRWETVWGANWWQRAGRILVDGFGSSFGGRSLCLQTDAAPNLPFEVQVEVKLDDEGGAAGLVFHADGGDRHYGFYPSNGNIRLTRFNGPDVDSWTILFNEPHPGYRPSEWNTFKVRVEEGRFILFLNEQEVLTSADDVLSVGRTGFATFRGTSAEFRRFQIGDSIPSALPNDDDASVISEIIATVSAVRPANAAAVKNMQALSRYSSRALETEARRLEQRAIQLRRLAVDVHAANVRSQILQALGLSKDGSDNPEANPPDLLLAALLIAAMDNDEVEVNAYIEIVDRLADEIRNSFTDDLSELERLGLLDEMMFQELGFHGAVFEYNTRSSSYLNEVIDDREGLPIALSVLYIEVARRLKLNVVGVGLPGHFVVRFEPESPGVDSQLIDVFKKGERLNMEDVQRLVAGRGYPMRPEFLEAQTATQIVQRMVTNLLALAEQSRDDDRVLRYLELLVSLDESDFQHRAKRMEIRARSGRLAEALEDLDWFTNQSDEVINKDALYELRSDLERQLNAQQIPN